MSLNVLLLTYSGFNSWDLGCSELSPSLTGCLEDCSLLMELFDFFLSLFSSFLLFCKYTETLRTKDDHQ